MGTEIRTVTTWVLNGETTLEEGDSVEVETKNGEKAKGEVYILYNDSIQIESEQLGDSITIEIDNIESIRRTN